MEIVLASIQFIVSDCTKGQYYLFLLAIDKIENTSPNDKAFL
jgi:hypothetical protein